MMKSKTKGALIAIGFWVIFIFVVIFVVYALSEGTLTGKIQYEVWDENSWDGIDGTVYVYDLEMNLLENNKVIDGDGFSEDTYTFGEEFYFKFEFAGYVENTTKRKLGVYSHDAKVNVLHQFLTQAGEGAADG